MLAGSGYGALDGRKVLGASAEEAGNRVRAGIHVGFQSHPWLGPPAYLLGSGVGEVDRKKGVHMRCLHTSRVKVINSSQRHSRKEAHLSADRRQKEHDSGLRCCVSCLSFPVCNMRAMLWL